MSLLPHDPASDLYHQAEAIDICRPEHCFHAFDALYCALTFAEPIPPKFKDEKYPLFVTWNTLPSRPGRSHRLRGCIGCFDSLPIREGLAEYALISAFHDTRFRKIDKSELETLQCGVSFLTDFEDAVSYLDWTVGVHGIQISFPHPSLLTPNSGTPSPLSSAYSLLTPKVTKKQKFSATYLPDVIPEQGWDKVDAVDSAIHKAGWTGKITEEIRRSIKLRRYQSRVCTVSWDDYIEWREMNSSKA